MSELSKLDRRHKEEESFNTFKEIVKIIVQAREYYNINDFLKQISVN